MICSKCGEDKAEAVFSRNQTACKECQKEYSRQWYRKNKDRKKRRRRMPKKESVRGGQFLRMTPEEEIKFVFEKNYATFRDIDAAELATAKHFQEKADRLSLGVKITKTVVNHWRMRNGVHVSRQKTDTEQPNGQIAPILKGIMEQLRNLSAKVDSIDSQIHKKVIYAKNVFPCSDDESPVEVKLPDHGEAKL